METYKLHYETAAGELAEMTFKTRMLSPRLMKELSALDGTIIDAAKRARQFMLLDEKSMREVLLGAADKTQKALIDSVIAKITAGTMSETDVVELFDTGTQAAEKNIDVYCSMVRLVIDPRSLTAEQQATLNEADFWERVDMEDVRKIAERFRASLR